MRRVINTIQGDPLFLLCVIAEVFLVNILMRVRQILKTLKSWRRKIIAAFISAVFLGVFCASLNKLELHVNDTAQDIQKVPGTNGKKEKKTREQWSGCADFVLSCAGYSVGIGNIWRFPYLCYKNGGGAFLIPYLIFLVIGAFPMFLLEYSISQFSSRSPLNIWAICPIMKGAGYGMIMVNLFMTLYFNAMLAWVLYYLYNSFSSSPPWSTCDNYWNTRACYDMSEQMVPHMNQSVATNQSPSYSVYYNGSWVNKSTQSDLHLTASEEFWRFNVLQLTDGLEDMGEVRIPLFVCLIIAWFLTFISVCWGIKVTGKIVYVTVLFPYIVLLIFLIKGLLLPGAMNGLKFYLVPEWDTLFSTKVWGEAALQIFVSSGMGFGGLLTYASYNKFHNNCYRDAMIGPLINSGTSILAGCVTFAVLGFMAEEKGVSVDKVVTQGPGLIFDAYPSALAKFSMSPMWSVLFFLLMLCVGIDTQFGMVETIICSLRDEFPNFLGHRKLWITAILCICQCVLGIPLIMQGGIYVIQIIDWYFALFTVMVVCIMECIIIGWIYGVPQFYDDIQLMIGYKPSVWWSFCWKYITPSFLLLVLTFNMAQLQPVSYGVYEYPSWAIAVGWMIGLCSLVPIVVYMIIAVWKENGTVLQRVKKAFKPADEWGPQLPSMGRKSVDLYEHDITKMKTETTEALL